MGHSAHAIGWLGLCAFDQTAGRYGPYRQTGMMTPENRYIDVNLALEAALALAPGCRNKAELARTVNAQYPVFERSEAAWRGLINRSDDYREQIEEALGTELYPITERLPEPEVQNVGVFAGEWPDPSEVLDRSFRQWDAVEKRQERKRRQEIAVPYGPFALAFVADQHLGAPGVNYRRMFQEARIIRATPGMRAVTVGDVLDNMIIGRLAAARLGGYQLSITDEWVLAHEYLKILLPDLVASVAGNHDNWTATLAGVDVFRGLLTGMRSDVIYDQHQAFVTVRVGDAMFPGKIRHKWSGYSWYNETHGIEKSAKEDHDFVWAVGAHDHRGAVCRDFTHAGGEGLAVKCGSYKWVDVYADQIGVGKSGRSTAAVIVYEEDGTMQGFNNLEKASEYMRFRYRL